MPLNYSCLALIFEQPFYYHGHLRWSYGWATPNYAGAFLATIEPVIWILAKLAYDKSRNKAVNGFQFAAELVFWFLLSRTDSRGSIVAAFGARATWQAMQGELTAIKTWALYLLAPMICIVSSGFGSRIYNAIATTDPSVEHRLELWLAGLRMSAASPWTGWGSGKSGIIYMNWYENPGHNEIFFTMVNSYLSLTVEHGLPVFFLVVFIAGCLVHGGMAAAKSAATANRTSRALAVGAATSVLAAWLVANIFTTLWMVPSLWIVPGIALCIIAGSRDTWQALGPKTILRCVSLSLGAGLLLVFSGRILDSRSQVRVRHGKHDMITLEKRTTPLEKQKWSRIEILPDPLVLGDYPGRLLRAWMQQPDGPEHLTIYTKTESIEGDKESTQGNRTLVLVGREASDLKSIRVLPTDNLIWVHPLQLNKEDMGHLRGMKAVIVLPGIDQAGTDDAIKTEANALGAKVVFSPDTGVDLQAAWPEVMKAAIPAP